MPLNRPQREQRKRVRGYRQPDNCRYVGRPTKYGNPYTIKQDEHGRWVIMGANIPNQIGYKHEDDAAIQMLSMYRKYLRQQIAIGKIDLSELKRYDYLSCFCPLNRSCHVDIIIQEMGGV